MRDRNGIDTSENDQFQILVYFHIERDCILEATEQNIIVMEKKKTMLFIDESVSWGGE